MSVYEINLICYRVAHDERFRDRLRADPVTQLAEFALTEPERAELLAGDVSALYDRGAHPVLLVRLGAYRVLGLTPELYADRIRASRHRPADR